MHYAYMGNVTIEVIFWVKAYSVKPPTNLKTVCQIEIAVRFDMEYFNLEMDRRQNPKNFRGLTSKLQTLIIP